MQPVPSKGQLKQLVRELSSGQELEPEKLIVWLSEHGYNRLEQVEVPGDFAVRGGIIDIYLPGEFDQSGDQVGLSVRIDFFGDQIESIKQFSLDTLGSLAKMDSVRLIDLRGKLDDGESVSLFAHLPEETLVILWAPLEIAEQSKSYLDRLPEEVKGIYPLAAVLKNAERFSRLELSQFDQGAIAIQSLVGGEAVPHVKLPVRSIQKFETEAKKAIAELAETAATHEVTVFCENEGEAKRFGELVEQEQKGLLKKLRLVLGYLHHGFIWGEEGEEGSGLRVQGSGKREKRCHSPFFLLLLNPEPRTLNPSMHAGYFPRSPYYCETLPSRRAGLMHFRI
jgi:transcription-repair coupling factor (superfamily II helicase)